MPPRPSRGPAGKSQRTNGSGPRSARSTSSNNKGIQLRRTSITASTSDEDADSHDEDDAIRVDDGAPLVDGTAKQVRGGGRKRRGKVAAYQKGERAGASKWSVALVIVAVLAVVAAAGYWYLGSTAAPSSTNEAAKQGATDLGVDRAQPSPPVAAVPEAVPAVSEPEPVKPASDSVPVPPTDSKPAPPADAADKKPAPIPKKPTTDDNRASSGAGGMQVHPEPVVPQPRLALGSWDYCEAPVVLPKPGADDPNESTHTLHHAFIFVRHGTSTISEVEIFEVMQSN